MKLTTTIDHAELGPEGRADLVALIGELIDFADEHGIDLIAALRGEDLAEARTEAQTWTPPPPPPLEYSYELSLDGLEQVRFEVQSSRKTTGQTIDGQYAFHAADVDTVRQELGDLAAYFSSVGIPTTATVSEYPGGDAIRIDLTLPAAFSSYTGLTWTLTAWTPDNGGNPKEVPLTSPAAALPAPVAPAGSDGADEGGSDGADAPSQSWLAQELAKAAGVSAGRVPAGETGGTMRYGLYWNPGADGEYQLRFDGELSTPLTPGAPASAIDAALEALDGITSAEVSGEPGSWELALEAAPGGTLQEHDLNFDGDMALVYWGA